MNNISFKMYEGVNLICFWSSSCPACHVSMLYLEKIKTEYQSRGLYFIPIHHPIGEFDLDKTKALTVASGLGITDEIIFDDDHKIGGELGVDALPTYFLFDREGKLRRHARGEFGVKMIEQALIRLFDEDEAQGKEKFAESFPMSFAL